MLELTDRQTKILKAIIEEYIETAGSVGSETLDKKYNLGVSPATIRNEMVKLTKMGLLKQLHVSAGRVPSPIALKFYIHQLMKEEQLGVVDEVQVKEKIWDYRHDPVKLYQATTKTLADKTKSLAVAITNEGNLYHSGYAHILDMPEFFDIDVTKNVLSLIEDFDQLHGFIGRSTGEEIIHTLIGDDFGFEPLESCSMIFTNFRLHGKEEGSLGVIGPCRLNYALIVPTVKYFGHLLEEILNA